MMRNVLKQWPVLLAVYAAAVAQAADCVAYFRCFEALNGRVELMASGELRHYDDCGRYLGKTVPEFDDTRHFYDDYGRKLGKAEMTNDAVIFYNETGSVIGRMEKGVDGVVHYYDVRHRVQGWSRTENNGGLTCYYDARGRLRGTTRREEHEVRFYDSYGQYQGKSVSE